MSAFEALRRVLGDTVRFKSLRDRIEILFEGQVRTWSRGTSGWLVMPVEREPAGFYLISEDREGQRCGQEVLAAFLGPAVATIKPAPMSPGNEGADGILRAVGINHLSHLQRTDASALAMLERLEDAVATVTGTEVRRRSVRPSHVDLLRDFRLALLRGNSRVAEHALDELRLTGRLSAENLRFLKVELLGRLERWSELRDLPYLQEMLRARRPRAVNEILLEMLWWKEVAPLYTSELSAEDVYRHADLSSRYGVILNAVDVPITESGRKVTAVAAQVQGDRGRLERLLRAAATDAERGWLRSLVTHDDTAARPRPAILPTIQELFQQAQYGAVTRAFLESPEPSEADMAVQAVLEGDETNQAPAVRSLVSGFVEEGRLRPDRRLLRDLEELDRLVGGSCHSWTEWCARLGRDERWPDAAQVLRSQHHQWAGLESLSYAETRAAAENVLSAWAGANQEQVVAALDLLCSAAAKAAATMQAGEFFDVVLMLLVDQPSLSAPVRDAYLLLIVRLLESGPAESRYQETLNNALLLWRRIASPAAVDWGLSLVDVLLYAPSPVPEARLATVSEVINKIRSFQQRLSARQDSESETLAGEAGLPVRQPQEQTSDADTVWKRLDGSVVGVYSLLPRAAASLEKRLSRLCSPRAVEGNTDKVATAALRSLVARADYLIVDTWHATHSATSAIDQARDRDKQIMPQGQGVTGFMQALEQHLSSA
ncbi:protein DpdD [Actinomadura luteofluorescens]